ncbi:MAG: DUF6145 family protein [Butyrivibrio sp.]
MEEKEVVLCASSAYDKKYFLNEEFNRLPESIKDELKIMSVLFTEDVGGILILKFTEEGSLTLETVADEGDLLYDEIGAALKVKKIRAEHVDTFEALEMFYRVFFLHEAADI